MIVLEYWVRAPVFYGNLREKTVFHETYRNIVCSYRNLRKSLETSGSLRENVSRSPVLQFPLSFRVRYIYIYIYIHI